MTDQDFRAWAGAVLCAGFDGEQMGRHAEDLIGRLRVQNVILFGRNISSFAQVRALTEQLQAFAQACGHDLPLLICADQENGIVRRFADDVPGLPGNMAIGAAGDADMAQAVGLITGRLLRAAGIHMDLAPVLDVNNNPDNPVIGVRSFGEDPAAAAALGVAFARGLAQAGVIACGKHFPGHGDTVADSHLALPLVAHGLERLRAVELVPFQAAIAAGVEALMTAHVVFPAAGGADPATLSEAVLTGLLRTELAFSGVIMTDCLEMRAISDTVGVGRGAVRALCAGADLVLVSHHLQRQEEALAAIVAAAESGELPPERLREAAQRVRALRRRRLRLRGPSQESSQGLPQESSQESSQGLPQGLPQRPSQESSQEGVARLLAEAARLQRQIAAMAVTVLRNDQGVLPLVAWKTPPQRIVLLCDRLRPRMMAAGASSGNQVLQEELMRVLPAATVSLCEIDVEGRGIDAAVAACQAADLIIVSVNGLGNPHFLQAIRGITVAARQPVAAIAAQSPYDLRAAPFCDMATQLAVYEETPWMMRAAADAIIHGGANGRAPVSISARLPRGSGQTAAR
ncbi:MAG: beta-N-acetylhexosaminidase [Bacilli bacterium]